LKKEVESTVAALHSEFIETVTAREATMLPGIMPATLASLVSFFSDCFTKPSFVTFQHLITGWLVCLGKHTVTGLLRASGALGLKHPSCFHRFFNQAAWRLESFSLRLTDLVLSFFPDQRQISLVIDDTLSRHTGKWIDSAAMHHDPLRSTKTKKFFSFGHVWVVVAILFRLPVLQVDVALPIFIRLYRPKKLCQQYHWDFFTKPQLAAQMLQTLAQRYPQRRFDVVADAAYTNHTLLSHLPPLLTFIGRGPLKAAIYDLPPQLPSKRGGRPRVRGNKQASPYQRAQEKKGFVRLRMKAYQETVDIRVKVFDGLWWSQSGKCWVRWVLIKGWPKHKTDDVLLSTETQLSAHEMIKRYCLRWKIEVTFHEAKGHLGVEEAQNRKAKGHSVIDVEARGAPDWS
jgi:hypothetical protein